MFGSGSEPDAAVDLLNAGTTLWVTRLAPGDERVTPEAPTAYALVVRGSVEVEGVGRLDEGDALVLTRSPFWVDGKQRMFAEPPHMQASMLFLPADARAPEVGDLVDDVEQAHPPGGDGRGEAVGADAELHVRSSVGSGRAWSA